MCFTRFCVVLRKYHPLKFQTPTATTPTDEKKMLILHKIIQTTYYYYTHCLDQILSDIMRSNFKASSALYK